MFLKRRRTRVLLAAAAAGCITVAGLNVMGADAGVGNSGPVSIALSGEMFIDGATIDVTLPGILGTVSGTVAPDGTLSLPTIDFDDVPITVAGIPSTVEITTPGAWGGNIDPTSGAVTITGTLFANITINAPLGANPCALGPLDLNLTTGTSGPVGKQATGTPYNQGSGVATVVDRNFGLPVTVESPTCSAAAVGLINGGLPLPIAAGDATATFTASFDPVLNDATTTSAEATTTTTAAATTTTAAPVTTTTGGPAGATLSIADETINEPDKKPAKLTFTVSLSAPQTSTVKVKVATVDGSASSVDKADFTAVKPKTISIPKGQTSKTFDVSITGDTTAEDTETFTVVMTEPVGATTPDPDAVGTITDDDPIHISIADQSFPEGDKNSNAEVAVTIDRASDCTVKGKLTTSNGTATEPGDYKKKNNAGVTIKAGATSGVLKITIVGDNLAEGDETFTVTLSSPTCAEIDGATATITIVDDDGIPT